jgi:glycosyltransferase 2 family protein
MEDRPRKETEAEDRAHDLARSRALRKTVAQSFFQGQLLFILKNVIGWVLILGSPIVGIGVPGPGGFPMFIIGFALVTLPGKRKMTSHVMRGRPIRIKPGPLILLTTVMSVVAVGSLLWFVHWKKVWLLDKLNLEGSRVSEIVLLLIGVSILACVVVWLVIKLSIWGTNIALRGLPIVRKTIRPWLRKKGLHLLPKRRKLIDNQSVNVNENEILEISQENTDRAMAIGKWLLQWLKRAAILALVLYIFSWILKPVFDQWPETSQTLRRISILDLVAATTMFTLFLALPRAMNWRMIIKSFGYPIPRLAALRIWITSEMARYVPSGVFQFVGRAKLARPYGVRGSHCNTSQILELAIFLLANILMAAFFMSMVGFRRLEGDARYWMIVGMGLAPLLSILLLPRIFYPLANLLLTKFGKPAITNRLPTKRVLRLLGVALLGLLWQSLAIWILLRGPLDLQWGDFKVIAGTYCLAWIAGFIVVISPGGMGVREVVLLAVLPHTLRPVDGLDLNQKVTIAALVVLLRLMTIVSELILLAVSHALDLRGALGDITPVKQDADETSPG